MKKIRIGSRASKLALKQTKIFIDSCERGDDWYEIVKITTMGDKILDKPLYDIGGKALFLKEIEEALLARQIDIAVHSMKDIPGKLPDGLIVGAVLEREDPRDVLLSYKSKTIADLPFGAVIGTSSVRRHAAISLLRSDIKVHDMRGNVPTRIEKWKNSNLDGIILAAAGLRRLGLFDSSYCNIISTKDMVPAVGQGVIAVEIRENDEQMKLLCEQVNHKPTWLALQAERGFLEYLDADCKTPLGAFARLSEDPDLLEVDYFLSGHRLTSVTKVSKGYESGVSAGEALKQALEKNIII